jgi:hypothetical protein
MSTQTKQTILNKLLRMRVINTDIYNKLVVTPFKNLHQLLAYLEKELNIFLTKSQVLELI